MPDEHDLARLTDELAARSASLPSDYLRGKTWMRDTLIALLDCSMVEAEQLVDRLEARGFVSFTGDPASLKPPSWLDVSSADTLTRAALRTAGELLGFAETRGARPGRCCP